MLVTVVTEGGNTGASCIADRLGVLSINAAGMEGRERGQSWFLIGQISCQSMTTPGELFFYWLRMLPGDRAWRAAEAEAEAAGAAAAGGMKAAPRRRRLPGPLVLLLLSLSSLSFLPLEAAGAKDPISVIPLQEGHASRHNESQRFCYTNTRQPRWNDIWTRTQIRVTSSRMIRVTQVDSEEELERFSVWNVLSSFLRGKLNDTSIDVDLYSNKTCLKVELLEPGTDYSVVLFRRFDPKLFLVFFLGLLLFFCGDTLSRSQIFYYSAGISIGLLASLLILVYVLSKVMPKKSPVYFLLFGGWSFSLYLLQLIFKNLREICTSYWQYLLGYLLLVGFLSFAVCYRYGPLENERSINLLSWALQLLGLLLMYSGIQIHPIALGLVLVAVCTKNLDYPLQWAFAAYRRVQSSKLGPTPPRLLTEEEYRLQGEVETRKALAQLRSSCRSPEFSAWSTVSRIQSPKRFADFVGGASHITPHEASAHEQEFGLGSLFNEQLFEEDDDDDDDDDDDNEEDEENVNDPSAGDHKSDSMLHNHLDVHVLEGDTHERNFGPVPLVPACSAPAWSYAEGAASELLLLLLLQICQGLQLVGPHLCLGFNPVWIPKPPTLPQGSCGASGSAGCPWMWCWGESHAQPPLPVPELRMSVDVLPPCLTALLLLLLLSQWVRAGSEGDPTDVPAPSAGWGALPKHKAGRDTPIYATC